MKEKRGRVLWLVDAAYLFNAQRSIGGDYTFGYMELRAKLEQNGPIWRAYYLNSTPDPPTDQQDAFHTFLRRAPPSGPKIITKLYGLKSPKISRVFCETCGRNVTAQCGNDESSSGHKLSREIQKGVDVGLATLALTLVNDYDTLLLSSGDGDFTDMVEYLSQHGKRLELAVFRLGVATELQARTDEFHWIDDFYEEVRNQRQMPAGYHGAIT